MTGVGLKEPANFLGSRPSKFKVWYGEKRISVTQRELTFSDIPQMGDIQILFRPSESRRRTEAVVKPKEPPASNLVPL